MNRVWVYYQKEMLEARRSYKLIWVPVVFLLLGIMQPVMTFYLPEILSMSGDVPPEAAALFTTPTPEEVIASTLSQYNTIGLLVLVLSSMNILAGERATGTIELVLSRSVSTLSLITAKWAAMMTLLILSFGLGLSGAAYYTYQLIGPVEWNLLIGGGLIYTLWLAWIVTLVLPLGAVLKGPAAAFISLGAAAALSLISGLFSSTMLWNPGRLGSLASQWLMGNEVGTWSPAGAAVIIIILSVSSAALLLRERPLSLQS
ncbi:ABC transporter permease [Paenibacillus dakarensis]|uniref:ABC transporter permease n=1 Tax=Paenibacillus dakarensis TaxID=1527293 RepID=UPI000AFF57EE|nr:ABC transporter permease subunit [Paenibacillus dakarensis]